MGPACVCLSVPRYKIIHSTSTLVLCCTPAVCSGEHCSPLLDCASASAADQASVSRLAEWSCAWPARLRGGYFCSAKSRGGYVWLHLRIKTSKCKIDSSYWTSNLLFICNLTSFLAYICDYKPFSQFLEGWCC